MNKIYFTADTHFFHANILKHCPERPYFGADEGVLHDEWWLICGIKQFKRRILFIL
jgi:calcineurin-like phosphoesterase family protein